MEQVTELILQSLVFSTRAQALRDVAALLVETQEKKMDLDQTLGTLRLYFTAETKRLEAQTATLTAAVKALKK